jgi:NAD(P)H-hydrate repair Nnr-like enzyme with NAD(P)H-hydrate epimerase domain
MYSPTKAIVLATISTTAKAVVANVVPSTLSSKVFSSAMRTFSGTSSGKAIVTTTLAKLKPALIISRVRKSFGVIFEELTVELYDPAVS